ncbi:Holliday junction resolvase RuvX [Mycoplasma sp. 394]
MRKLSLDLGTKSCGFAITDENEIIAIGLENFEMDENDFQAVINKIKMYINQYQIDGLILGYPLKISGQKSERTLMVEQFAKLLDENFNIPYLFVNEQYTTKKAHETLISAGYTRAKRKLYKDKIAAVLILQEYLDYYKHRKEIKWNYHKQQ